MIKDLITCVKLIPYGKRARLNIVCGIVCIVISVLAVVISLWESDAATASFYPAFFMFEGFIFLTQPSMTIAQRGGLAFAPLRRAADIYYQPICVFAAATAANVLWGIIGCIAAAVSPATVNMSVFTLSMGVVMTIMFAWSVTLMKMNVGGYIVGIIIMIVVLVGSQDMAGEVLSNIKEIQNPITVVLLAALACEAASAVISLIDCFVLKCLYKKEYSKFTKQLVDMN